MLIELAQYDFAHRILAHLKDDSQTVATTLVAHICDALNYLVAHQVTNFLQHYRLVDQIRDLRDDNLFPAFFGLCDFSACSYLDDSAPCEVAL